MVLFSSEIMVNGLIDRGLLQSTVPFHHDSPAVCFPDQGNHGGKGTVLICHSNVLVLAMYQAYVDST